MKQKEIDSFHQGFSAEVESEQCGWIVDKYGISWQIVLRMFLDFATKLSPATYQKINQQNEKKRNRSNRTTNLNLLDNDAAILEVSLSFFIPK
ncbi:hypothetical protein CIRMBP1315_00588 [Enterococcus cecorum]|uniref:VOC family protein n=1 Tax=Enterococcus cecorum TaxID=44008 RepID=UPI000A7E22FE|nr:VOC family protein [Enterococcus cecorum]CAI3368873.1 hypothetical protein CIRMBP1315_00588 [Enterococcus cecorum]